MCGQGVIFGENTNFFQFEMYLKNTYGPERYCYNCATCVDLKNAIEIHCSGPNIH